MGTTIISPKFGLDTARDGVKNNRAIDHIEIVLHTSETWLPLVLSQAGFFPSNGEVRRNRPDLWRDVIHGERVKFSWAEVLICKHGRDSDVGC